MPRVGPSFRDATRVAGANTDIWTDIYLSNAESMAAEVDETVRRLEEVAAALRAGDPAALGEWNEGAPTTGGGCSRPIWRAGRCTSCACRCRTGRAIVAQLALALGRAGVNIVDMALAPAPDMRSGAITLWIAGDEAAARARRPWSTSSTSATGPSREPPLRPRRAAARAASRRPRTSRSRTAPRCSAR